MASKKRPQSPCNDNLGKQNKETNIAHKVKGLIYFLKIFALINLEVRDQVFIEGKGAKPA